MIKHPLIMNFPAPADFYPKDPGPCPSPCPAFTLSRILLATAKGRGCPKYRLATLIVLIVI